MCHGHLGRAPSRAGRPWHAAGRTLFCPAHGGKILAKEQEFTVWQYGGGFTPPYGEANSPLHPKLRTPGPSGMAIVAMPVRGGPSMATRKYHEIRENLMLALDT